MDQEDQDIQLYNVTLGIDDVRVLQYSVDISLKNWPGAPARPAEEQEYLWHTRDWLNKIILEHTFSTM